MSLTIPVQTSLVISRQPLKIPMKSVGTPNVQSRIVSLNPSTLLPLKRAFRFHSDDEAKEAKQGFLRESTTIFLQRRHRPTVEKIRYVLRRP
ncbi:hypothetical protein TNCV_2213701 [Trichonephila clavipes]|nr:hypothetical protein TNCV_2213701 [Trichonephila clavipes]